MKIRPRTNRSPYTREAIERTPPAGPARRSQKRRIECLLPAITASLAFASKEATPTPTARANGFHRTLHRRHQVSPLSLKRRHFFSRSAASSSPFLLLLLLYSLLSFLRCSEMDEEKEAPPPQDLTLGWVRDALIRQEDSIVFALIERARFPYNAHVYDPSLLPQQGGRSLVEAFARGAEVLQAKVPSFLSFLGHPLHDLL